jgi:hypothetical protein
VRESVKKKKDRKKNRARGRQGDGPKRQREGEKKKGGLVGWMDGMGWDGMGWDGCEVIKLARYLRVAEKGLGKGTRTRTNTSQCSEDWLQDWGPAWRIVGR